MRHPVCEELRWADAPGNVVLSAHSTSLPRDSVANVALVLAVNNQQLDECVGMITEREQQQILNGIDMVLGKA